MRSIQVVADIVGRSAADSFPLLARMENYPRYSEAVLDLQVTPLAPDASQSTWKIKFGPGTAAWSQRDTFFPSEHTVRFTRLSGDIDEFIGAWTLRDTQGGCEAKFSAEFDTGLFLLASIVEPLIEDLLRENISAILRGLFSPAVFIRDQARECHS